MTTIFLHDYLQQISDLLDNDRVREAAAHCRHILQQYPKHLGTYRALAQALLEQGEYADAIDLFHRVLSAEPSDFISHLGLAIVYQEQSELTSAIWHMERAYEMKPYDAVVQDKLKQLYRQNAIPSPGRLSLTKGALARLYLRGDLYQQAASEFREILSQEESRVDIELLLAETLWRDGQRVEAVEICREVLKKLPNCVNALAILADVWFATGRTAEAEEYVQRLLELTQIDAKHIESETPLAHALNGNGQVRLPGAVEVAMLESLPVPAAEEEIQADWVDQASFEDDVLFGDEAAEADVSQDSDGLFGWLRDETPPEDDQFAEMGADSEQFELPAMGTSIPMAESMWLVDEDRGGDDDLGESDDAADWLMDLDDSADLQDRSQLDVFPDLHGEGAQNIDISPWESVESDADPGQDLTNWLKSDQPENQHGTDTPDNEESDWFGASSFHGRAKTGDETTLLNEDSEWLAMLDDMESQAQQPEEDAGEPLRTDVEDDRPEDLPVWSEPVDGEEPSPDEEAEPLSEWLKAQLSDSEETVGSADAEPVDDLPDWMHTGMFDSEEADAGEGSEISEEVEPLVFSTSEEAPMPDWLQSNEPSAEEEADVADLMNGDDQLSPESSLEENIPDWMLDEMAAEEPPAGFSALLGGSGTDELVQPAGFSREDDEAAVQESEVPDWLLMDQDFDSDANEPSDQIHEEQESGSRASDPYQDDNELPAWLAAEQGSQALDSDFVEGAGEDIGPPEAGQLDEIPAWLGGSDSSDEAETRRAEQRLDSMDMKLSEPTVEGEMDNAAAEVAGFEDDAELLLDWEDEPDLEVLDDQPEQQEDDMSEWLFSDDLDSPSDDLKQFDEPLDLAESPPNDAQNEAELDWLTGDDSLSEDDSDSLLEADSERDLQPAADEIPDWLKTGQFQLDDQGEGQLESLDSEVGIVPAALQEPALLGTDQTDLKPDAEFQLDTADELPDWLSSGVFEEDDDAALADGDEEMTVLGLSQGLDLALVDDLDDIAVEYGATSDAVDIQEPFETESGQSGEIVWPSVGESAAQEEDDAMVAKEEEHAPDLAELSLNENQIDLAGAEAASEELGDQLTAVDSSWRDLVDDVTDELPEDLDDAMAWIEELAANKEAPVEELPTIAKAIESEEEAIGQAEPEIISPQSSETDSVSPEPSDTRAGIEEDPLKELFEDSDFTLESDAIDIDGMLEQMPTTDSEFDLEMDFEAILDAQGTGDDDDFLSKLTEISTDSDIDLSWTDSDGLAEDNEIADGLSAFDEFQTSEDIPDEAYEMASSPDMLQQSEDWLEQSIDDEIVPVHELRTEETAPPSDRMEAGAEDDPKDSAYRTESVAEIEMPVTPDETEEEFEEAIAWLDEMSDGTSEERRDSKEEPEGDSLEAALAEMFTNPAQESVEAAELQDALDWLAQLAEQEGTPIAESLSEEVSTLEVADEELQEALDWLEKLAWEQETADGDQETLPDLGLSGSYGRPGSDDNLADLLDETDEADDNLLWIEKHPSSSGLGFNELDESDGTSELIEALESVEPAAAESPAMGDDDEILDFDAELMAGLPSEAGAALDWPDEAEELSVSEAESSVDDADEMSPHLAESSEEMDAPAELNIKPTFGADEDAMFELSVGVSEGVLEGGFLDDLPEDADAALEWLEQFVETDEVEADLESATLEEPIDQLLEEPDAATGVAVDEPSTGDAPTLDIKPTFGGDDDAMFELSVGVSEGVLEEGFLDDLPDDADAALEWLEQFVETDAEDGPESSSAGETLLAEQPESDADIVKDQQQQDGGAAAELPESPTLDIKPTFGADDDAMFELSVGMSEGVLEEGFLDDLPEDPDDALAWLESFVGDEYQEGTELDPRDETQDAQESAPVEAKRSKVADLAREILGEMGEELDADLLEGIPDDPDEAVAWLQQFVVDEPDSDEESDSEAFGLESTVAADSDLDQSFLDNMPEDPDDAMSWLESVAADDTYLGMDLDDHLPDVAELAIDSEVAVEALLSGEVSDSDFDELSDLGGLLSGEAAAPEEIGVEPEINLDSGVSDSLPDWLTFEPGQEGASDKTEEWLQSLPEPDVAGWLEGEEAATVSGVYDFNASLTQEEARFGTGQLPSLDPLPSREASRPISAEKSHPVESGGTLKDQETLELARQALANSQYKEAAVHYGSMVESEDQLELLIEELKNALAEHGKQAPLWRVLGDAYMGNGQLQEALDAYRLTLDQM